MDHSAGTTFRQWAELDALPQLTEVVEESSYNIVTNILPHEPYFLNENCIPSQQPLELPDSEVRARGYSSLFSLQHANAARCTMELVANYMDHLREQGVYDSTKIVVVSDHGIVGKVLDNSSRAVAGGTQDSFFVRTRSLLLVKERNAQGPLSISEEFRPNADVPAIVCEEIGGCINPYLEGRPALVVDHDNPFEVTFVPWQFTLQERDRFKILSRYLVHGKDPYSAENWEKVE